MLKEILRKILKRITNIFLNPGVTNSEAVTKYFKVVRECNYMAEEISSFYTSFEKPANGTSSWASFLYLGLSCYFGTLLVILYLWGPLPFFLRTGILCFCLVYSLSVNYYTLVYIFQGLIRSIYLKSPVLASLMFKSLIVLLVFILQHHWLYLIFLGLLMVWTKAPMYLIFIGFMTNLIKLVLLHRDATFLVLKLNLKEFNDKIALDSKILLTWHNLEVLELWFLSSYISFPEDKHVRDLFIIQLALYKEIDMLYGWDFTGPVPDKYNVRLDLYNENDIYGTNFNTYYKQIIKR